MAISTMNRVKGGLYGAVVGDVIGVPYEFKEPNDITAVGGESVIDVDFSKHTAPMQKTYPSVPFGYWSDDTSTILALTHALSTHGNAKEIQPAFIRRLSEWRYDKRFTVNNRVFDIGVQTSSAIEYLNDHPDALCDRYDLQAQGNGALMRCLPVALVGMSVDDILLFAELHTVVTHNSPVAIVCSQYYTLIAHYLLQHQSFIEARYNAVQRLKKHHSAQPICQVVLTKIGTAPCEGSGWVIDSLATTFQILEQTVTYEQAIRQAVVLGNDSDTTACIVGGLAGIMYGFDAIPLRWVNHIADSIQIDHAYKMIETFWK